jgi:putative ABC transport system permease protein
MRPGGGATGLLDEALAGLAWRPGRTVLAAAGTVLGVGALVGVLGLLSTAGGQIGSGYTALSATQVVLVQAPPPAGAPPRLEFPPDADARVAALRGVRAAGTLWTVDAPIRHVSAVPPTAVVPVGDAGGRPAVVAVSAGALRAIRAHVAAGMPYDDFAERRAELVAVLGAAAARRLGVGRLDGQPAIFVDGVPLTVVGIIDAAARRPDLLDDVLVPRGTAQRLWGTPGAASPPQMIIDTRLGAAALIGREAPQALRPDDPGVFTARVAGKPRTPRGAAVGERGALLLALAVVCLIVGALSIAIRTLLAVVERMADPSAGGARLLMAEGTVLGGVGGLVGTGLAAILVVTVAVARHWTPVLKPATVIAAPLLGALTGLIASAYPALRATRIAGDRCAGSG